MTAFAILVLLTLGAQQAPRDIGRPEAVSGTAVIHGRVIDDSGQPINRALVVATGVPPGGARTTVTDAQGRYVLEQLPPARVTLSASRPPYPRATYGQLFPRGAGTEIVLTEGRRVEATIVVPRGAVITGTVHDHAGRPLPDLQVTAVGGAAASGTTDASGRFRIWGLTAGDYTVAAAHPHLRSHVAHVRPVTLRVGEEREVTLRLPDEAVPLARIEAHVLTPDGTFHPGTSLYLMDLATGTQVANGQIAAAGIFTMSSIPPGRYRAVARATRPPLTFWGSTELTVGGDDMVIAVRLAPGASVSGRIVTAGSAILDVTRIHVAMVDAENARGTFGMPGTSPKPDGTFEFIGLAPGTYHLAVSATTMAAGVSIVSAMVGGVDVFDVPLRVTTDGVAGIVVTVSDRVTSFEGTVRDADGRPAPHAAIVLYSSDERFWFPQSRRVALVRPDSEGTFSVRGLPEGAYEIAIVASAPSEWQAPAFLKSLAPSATVTLREGEPVRRDFVVR